MSQDGEPSRWKHRASRAWKRDRSRSEILSALLGGELLLEFLADHAETVLELGLIVLGAPWLENLLPHTWLVSAIEWSLWFAVLYVAIPFILGQRGRSILRPSLKLLLSGAGLATVLTYSHVTGPIIDQYLLVAPPGDHPNPVFHTTVLLVFVLAAMVLLGFYFEISPTYDFSEPGSDVVEVLSVLSNEPVRVADGRVQYEHPVNRLFAPQLLSAYLVGAAFMLGLAIVIVELFYPWTAVLFLAWILYRLLGRRLAGLLGESEAWSGRLDLEGRLLTAVRASIRLGGLPETLLVLVSFLLAYLVMAFGTLAFIVLVPAAGTAVVTGRVWPGAMLVLLGVTPVVAAGYTAWFWLREVNRMPHWQLQLLERHGSTEPPRGIIDGLGTPPVRPPDHLLVPTLLVFWWITVVLHVFADVSEIRQFGTGTGLLLAGCWLAIAAVLWSCVRWTRNHHPQTTTTEGRHIVASLAVEYFTVGTAIHLLVENAPASVESLGTPALLLFNPAFYLGFGLTILLAFIRVVNLSLTRETRLETSVLYGYRLAIGGLSVGILALSSIDTPLLWIIALVSFSLVPTIYLLRRLNETDSTP